MDKPLFIRIKACSTTPSSLKGRVYLSWFQFKITYGYDYEFIDAYPLDKNLIYQIHKIKVFENFHMV